MSTQAQPSINSHTGASPGSPSSPPVGQQGPPERLQIRRDWILHNRERSDESAYAVLEDTQHGKYFRIGEAERILLAALMEDPSVSRAKVAQLGHPQEFSESQLERFFQWLASIGAVEGVPAKEAANKGGLGWIFFAKFPLLAPNALLTKLDQRIGWLFAWQSAVVGLLIAFSGALIAWSHWETFLDSYNNLFTPWRGLWLIVVWCLLKIIHETAHAATCKRYGGDVRIAGIALFAFMPVAYVDVSSCWRFRSRWQRLHVTLAGVAIEFTLAGLAMFIWLYNDSLLIRNAAADVVLMASLTTALFNLNPLLKFDGYFALSDVTGVENLYQFGQRYARYFGGRYLLGLADKAPRLPERQAWWIKIYGVMAATWRFVTVAGILSTVAALLDGAGLALAFLGFISFAIAPLYSLMRHLARLRAEGLLHVPMLSLRLGMIAALALGMLFVLPAEYRRTAPGIVEYDPPSVLRAAADGFVEQVLAQDGQLVQKDQALFVMRNDRLNSDLRLAKMQLEQAKQQVRSARWLNDHAKLEEYEADLRAAQEHVEVLQEQVDGLTLRAPHAGRMVSRNVQLFEGTFVQQGTDLGVVGHEESKRLKISLSSWEASRSEEWQNEIVQVYVSGRTPWSDRVSRVETRATPIPIDPSLIATNGGSLPVVQHQDEEGPKLVEPRVTGYVSLSKEKSQQLYCGQRCFVRVPCWKQSIGAQLLNYLCDLSPASLTGTEG